MWPLKQIDKFIEPNPLFEEFNLRLENILTPNIEGTSAWDGVWLYHESEIFWKEKESKIPLSELPLISSFISDNFDLNHLRQITVFRLNKNSKLHPHRDMEGNLILGMIRVHYAMKTNKDSFLVIDGKKYHIPEGRFSSFSTSELHSAENNSDQDRIHIVLDLKYCDKHKNYFPKITLKVIYDLLLNSLSILFLVLRDILLNPKSIISRISSLIPRKKN